MSDRLFVVAIACVLEFAWLTAADAGFVQSFQMTGQLGLEVTGAAGGNMSMASGSLALSNTLAVPVKAFFYATDWQSGGAPITGTFNGVPLMGAVVQTDTTLPGISYTHRWDVTSFIAGPGSYNYSLSGLGPGVNPSLPGGSTIPGVALAVVYNDPSASANTLVTIMDGSLQLGEGLTTTDSESLTFMNQVAGSATIYSFTVFDDSAESGEVVSYNGAAIGGPIDNALGFNATLLTMSATSVAGSNVLTLSTDPADPNVDHMHWALAASIVTPVPEPASLVLAGLGLIGTGVWRSRRPSRGAHSTAA